MEKEHRTCNSRAISSSRPTSTDSSSYPTNSRVTGFRGHQTDQADIERSYAPQIQLSEQLLQAVEESAPTGFAAFDGKTDHRIVLMQLLSRAMQSFEAVLMLTRAGLTRHAMTITRSIYEDMIASYWATLRENRDSVVAKVMRQARLNDDRLDEAVAQIRGVPPDPFTSDQERESLNEEFARGTKSWFGRLPQAKQAIEQEWIRRGGNRRALDGFHNLLYQESNLYAHTTAQLMSYGAVQHGGRVYPHYLRRSVSDNEVKVVLGAAGFMLGAIAELVLQEFEASTDRLVRAREEHLYAMEFLLPEQRRMLGRNDLCWCGSGKKLKNCHES